MTHVQYYKTFWATFDMLKTIGERGIECIFVGYAEHSKTFRFYVIETNNSVLINFIIESTDAVFDENRFLSVPRPSLRIPDETEDTGGSVVPEEVTEEYHKTATSIHNLIIHQIDMKTAFLNGELDEEVYMNQPRGFIMPGNKNKVCKMIKSLYGLKKFDESGKSVIIGLYVDGMLIFGTHQVQVDLTKKFLSLRFSMKDMGEADVILVSTPMDTSDKLMPNNGLAVSHCEYFRVIVCLMYAMTCTRLDITFVVGKPSRYTSNSGKEAEWLKNSFLDIPLWFKLMAPISIRCNSAATLAKAYSQMYNGKSRHLGVRHSMIRELIINGVIHIEFVRSQQNLAEFNVNSRIFTRLKHMYLHIIPRMCLEPAEKEDEVFAS
nr:zinc finger, CCHC-type [Tanacetum cinerariifolium]